MRWFILLAACLWAAVSFAGEDFFQSDWAKRDVDVVLLGEVHDNPDHHALQARLIAAAQPDVVVFEMLTPDEAEALNAQPRDAEAMRAASEGFHWSNIADYAGVFAATSGQIVGAALPRADVRAAFDRVTN